MQVCHGKKEPLQHIKPNDWIVYYSPNTTLGGKDKLQALTAIGKIEARAPYQVSMDHGFCPFRRDVFWFESQETSIIPLLNQLDFTKNKKNWGYSLRFGLIAISEHDMQLFSAAMQVTIPHQISGAT